METNKNISKKKKETKNKKGTKKIIKKNEKIENVEIDEKEKTDILIKKISDTADGIINSNEETIVINPKDEYKKLSKKIGIDTKDDITISENGNIKPLLLKETTDKDKDKDKDKKVDIKLEVGISFDFFKNKFNSSKSLASLKSFIFKHKVILAFIVGVLITYSCVYFDTYLKKPIKQNDIVDISFKAYDGEKNIENLNADNLIFKVGNKNIIQEIDDSLITHKTGDTYNVDVTFAEDFADKDIAGKTLSFTITVNESYDKK